MHTSYLKLMHFILFFTVVFLLFAENISSFNTSFLFLAANLGGFNKTYEGGPEINPLL